MRKLYAVLSFLWLYTGVTNRAIAQNLVLNPSFETVNPASLKCSWYLTNSEMTAAISNWDMPTDGSTDVFHTSLPTSCFCSPYSTDPSAVGSQTPRTGNSMTALFTYGTGGCTPYREYVQGQLASSLVVGTTYRIEMYVSLADYSNRAASNIGVKFLTARVQTGSMCVWSLTPDVNYTGTPITDKNGWTRISFCYTATAPNLQYFAIGNFYNDASTPNTAVSGSQATTRYFLDDVSIVPSSSGATSASASGIITCINNSVNLSTNVAAASYTWAAPAGSSITSGVNSQSAIGQGGGAYTVTVNDPNSCGSPLSTAIINVSTDNTPPSASASSGGALTCATTNITLNSSPSGMNYNWTGPGIVSGGSTSNPVVNQAGTYNLTVTNPSNGCSSNTSVSVSQNTTPPGASASAGSALTCATTNISLSSSPSGMNYSWTGPGIVSGGNTASPVVNQAGTYNLTVTDPSNGCSSNTSVSVSQNTTPPGASASAGSALTCATTNISLSSSPSGMNYSWTGPGIMSGGNTASPVVNQAGTYNLTVTDPSNGCSSNTSVSVSQNTTPPSASASAGSALTCVTTNVTLNSSPSGMNYSWSGPGIVSGGSTANPLVNQPGTYNLTVTDPSNGCSSNTSVSVSQNTTPPGASAAGGSALTCATTTISLSSSPSGMNYNWTGPGIVSGSSTSSPVVNQPGTYNLVVTDPSNGCSSNTSIPVIQDITPPGASASVSAVITCTTTSINLSGNSTSGTNYSWTGPGIVSGANTANPLVNQPGVYNLTVTGPNGCTSTASVNVTQNASFPNATASSGSTVTCTSSTVSLAASPSGLTYTWSASAGSSITGNINAQTATANGPGPYTVIVYDPSNGCSATVSVSPTANTTPPAATAGATGSSTLTCNTPSFTLSGGPSTGMTYSWAGPGIVSGGNSSGPVVNQPGTYTLTVTDLVNGCSATASTTIFQDIITPTLSVGPSSYTTTCSSPTVQLTANSSANTVSYNWQVPSTGSLNNSSVSNPIASGTGVFTVVATNTVNGCSSAAAMLQVFADAALPVVSLSTNSLVLTCSATTVSVTVSASGSNLSYNWSPSPLSGGNTNSPVFNTPGNYAVVVTNTLNSCSTSANLSITTNTTAPSLNVVSPTQTLTCLTATAALTATSNAASSVYSWAGTGITGPSNAATVTVNQGGTYSVVVTDNANGCSSAVAFSSVITNTATPIVTLSAISTNSTISCASPTVMLSAISNPTSVSYSWSTGDNTQVTGIVSPGVVTATITNLVNGCSTVEQHNVTGNIINPPVVAGSGTLPCTSNTLALLASSTNSNVSYSWSGPSSSSILSGDNTASPICSEAGIYTVVVTDQATSCSTTTTVSVSQGSITAAFTADALSGVSPLNVNFTNQSTGAVSYNWNFGNGNTSSAVNPSQVFTDSFTYTVMLVATAGPCTDTAYATIIVDDDLVLEIPNVFTPNGDGTNDVFAIKTKGVKSLELEIFNRWGQKLYTFAGTKASWDGMTGQGQTVPDGTYFFFVKAFGTNGKTIEKQGSLNMFR